MVAGGGGGGGGGGGLWLLESLHIEPQAFLPDNDKVGMGMGSQKETVLKLCCYCIYA